MMSPDAFKAAAEMLQHMSKEDLEAMQHQVQGMSPEQMRRMGNPAGFGPSPAAAAEMLRSLRPDDLQALQRQLAGVPPEQLQRLMSSQLRAEGGSDQAHAGAVPPSWPAALQALQQRQQYELLSARNLKEEGNRFHSAGKYEKATEKYERARANLAGHSSPEAVLLRRACALNLMSCFLKSGQNGEAVKLGDEVLSVDSNNVKALYRRGQAHLRLGQANSGVSDLRKALQLSPEDETLAALLREAEQGLQEQRQAQGAETELGLEPKEESSAAQPPAGSEAQSPHLVPQQERTSGTAEVDGVLIEDVTEEEPTEQQKGGRDYGSATPSVFGLDPHTLRGIQNLSQLDPSVLAALSNGAMTPEMASLASRMIFSMPPAELEHMMRLAASFNPSAASGVVTGRGEGEGLAPQPIPNANGRLATSSSTGAPPSLAPQLFGGQRGKNPMEDPQLLQAMAEMTKNISPEAMASMSKQMGVPMTVEQAEQTKELLNRVKPETMAAMVKWAGWAQNVQRGALLQLQWLSRHRALALALLVLLVAVIGKLRGWF